MKHNIIRLATLALVLAVGLIAIAQTQRGEEKTSASALTVKPSAPLLLAADDAAATNDSNPLRPQSVPVSAPAPAATVDPRLSDPFGVRQPGNTVPSASTIPDAAPPATPLMPDPGIATAAAAANVEETPRPFPSAQLAAPLNADAEGRYTIDGGAAPSNEGTALPARDRQLDGAQTPQLTIEKTAPAEIQVGNPASFQVVVRNTGKATAGGVELRDEAPKGTRLLETNPRASRDAGGGLVWKLGDMKPGDEKTIEIKLMPVAEGEIGSVASVHFSAVASVRTLATKPLLRIETAAPQSVLIGEELTMKIKVSNPGSGVARGVVLIEQVPAGMRHPAGGELEYEIGDLQPNESRELELTLSAARPGKASNVLVVRGEGNLQSKDEMPLEVLAPQLKLAINGPKLRFLERETTYELSVSNPGTAPARNVRLQAKLPEGLRFLSTNNNGHYDPQTGTVAWALAELPVNETGVVQLTAMPEKIGEQKLTYRGTAEGALSVEEQKEIVVDGIAAIRFEVVDVADPVEKGGETTYEIRVLNQGSKAGSNVRIQVALPPAMQLVNAEGPSGDRPAVTGNIIAFEPINRLSPKVDATYRVCVKCTQAGDQRISVQMQTDAMQSPVTKEESTRVFSDD